MAARGSSSGAAARCSRGLNTVPALTSLRGGPGRRRCPRYGLSVKVCLGREDRLTIVVRAARAPPTHEGREPVVVCRRFKPAMTTVPLKSLTFNRYDRAASASIVSGSTRKRTSLTAGACAPGRGGGRARPACASARCLRHARQAYGARRETSLRCARPGLRLSSSARQQPGALPLARARDRRRRPCWPISAGSSAASGGRTRAGEARRHAPRAARRALRPRDLPLQRRSTSTPADVEAFFATVRSRAKLVVLRCRSRISRAIRRAYI